MIAAVQQIILILAERGNVILPLIHIDMACRAGAASATKCEKFIEAIVTDRFHQRKTDIRMDRMFGSVAAGHNDLNHVSAFAQAARMPAEMVGHERGNKIIAVIIPFAQVDRQVDAGRLAGVFQKLRPQFFVEKRIRTALIDQ